MTIFWMMRPRYWQPCAWASNLPKQGYRQSAASLASIGKLDQRDLRLSQNLSKTFLEMPREQMHWLCSKMRGWKANPSMNFA